MHRSFTHGMRGTLRVLALLLSVGTASLAHADAGKPLAPPSPSPSQGSPAPAVSLDGVVNINTATADELNRLPGIGKTRAQAILQLRTQIKRFDKLEDLMRVKGIGRATFRKLRPMLSLDGTTTLVKRPAAPKAAKKAQ